MLTVFANHSEVQIMEDKDLLRDLDRAAALPFTKYPPSPRWYPLLMGGCLSAIVAALFLIFGGNRLLGAILEIIAVLCFILFLTWYRKKWGTWPDMKEAPIEIRRVYRRFYVAYSSAWVLIVALAFLTSPALTVAVTFSVFTALVWVYERKVYPAAAALVRARLA